MKTTAFVSLIVAALSVAAVPHAQKRADPIDDSVILNYALTLEHLENAFYTGALAQFDEAAFKKAGLPSFARGRFSEIAAHEAVHVNLLETVLGDKATKPCTYKFPYTDPKSFAALSSALEGVGTSAYTGAAQFISSKPYLTAAASILATEARHASWVASAVNKGPGWSGAFDVPLSLDQVYTLAAAFITSCPSTNPALPVKAFPSLALSSPTPGKESTLTYNTTGTSSGPLFVAFLTGLGQEFATVKDGKVAIPGELLGTVYAVLTTNGTMADDSNIVAGPAILSFPFNSAGKLIKQ